MQSKLERLLNPETVAIVGASRNEERIGYAILKNLIHADFQGTLFPVNPKYNSISGIKCYPNILKVAGEIDLAIITVPEHLLPEVTEECCKKGVGGLVIMTRDADLQYDSPLTRSLLQMCRERQIPLLGMESFGFMRPPIQLNASMSPVLPRRGGIAFLSQSRSISRSILEWAEWKHIGFSAFISIGSMPDINLHHLIDYLGNDPYTRSILIFLESLTEVRRFLSAARAFSRNKPIIVLKAGKSPEGAAAIRQHTDWEPGAHVAYLAAFQRAGIIPVETIDQLFDAAEALASQARPEGNALAVISNGGGPGILAIDYLIRQGGQLPDFTNETLQFIREKAETRALRSGLIDLDEAASPTLFGEITGLCLKDRNVNGVLVLLSPTRGAKAEEYAEVLSRIRNRQDKPLFLSWMGYDASEKSRDVLRAYPLPVYRFPESAVDTFLRMAAYSRNIKALYETPKALPDSFLPQTEKAAELIRKIKRRKGRIAPEKESRQLLQYYSIPTAEEDEPEGPAKGEAVFDLRMGSARDPLFGPVLFFGTGGQYGGISQDIAYGIPPLNMELAQRLIEQTRIAALLRKSEEISSEGLNRLAFILYKFSYLIMDFPEIDQAVIDPLSISGETISIGMATIRLQDPPLPEKPGLYSHLVISPYPDKYIRETQLPDGRAILLRPIKPEDEALELEMIKKFSKQSLYYRFFGYVNHFTHEMMTRFTHIDYDREMAIVAETGEGEQREMIGVVRIVADADNENAEFAIAIPDPWQGLGLGSLLTDYILEIARERGIRKIFANVLTDNEGMIRIFKKRGFRFSQEDYKTLFAELDL